MRKYDTENDMCWLRKAYKVYLTGRELSTRTLFLGAPKTEDELISMLGRGAAAQLPKLCFLSCCFETLETIKGDTTCEFRMWYSNWKTGATNRVADVFCVCGCTFRNVLKKACAVGMMKQTDDNEDSWGLRKKEGEKTPYKPEAFGYGYCYNPNVGKLARKAYKLLFNRKFPFTSEDIVNIGNASQTVGLKRWTRAFQACCVPKMGVENE